MTTWSTNEIAEIWLRNGGSRNAVVNATAVALAESGGNDHAISPASDFGIWQINIIHFGYYGIALNNWMDPDVNARAAIAISGNGTNWAPWCTCWVDPGSNCGHGYLPNPEPGSPAGGWVHFVATVLGIVADLPQVIQTRKGLADVQHAWGMVQSFIGADARSRYGQLSTLTDHTRGNRR